VDAEYAYDDRQYSASYQGDYHLTLVATQPPGVQSVSGVLHLELPDSAARERRRFIAGLIGWFDSNAPDSSWRRITSNRDPTMPGAELIGAQLTIGQNNVLDGSRDRLRITARSARGFWGWWQESSFGIPIGPHPAPARAGYFCAERVNTLGRDSLSGA
jgi:hypothetical protein